MIRLRWVLAFLLSAALFLASCSDYPEMDEEILAFHLYNSGDFDPKNANPEYVKLLARSFGMSVLEVQKMQKHLLEKGSAAKTRKAAEAAMRAKVERRQIRSTSARNDFAVNVLAPYLALLAKSSTEVSDHCIRCDSELRETLRRRVFAKSGLLDGKFNERVCALYGWFFDEDEEHNSLSAFLDFFYGKSDGAHAPALNRLNGRLLQYGFYAEWTYGGFVLFGVNRYILDRMTYKGRPLAIVDLKRLVPGLMPSMLGYYSSGSQQVLVLDDMVDANVDEIAAEMAQIDYFEKYGDRSFDKYWHSVGLDLRTPTASEIYRRLMKKDFAGRSKRWIKKAQEMGVAVHEAKHIADQIEHPNLSLSLDLEFSAYVTMTIFSLAPNATLMLALDRLQSYAMANRTYALDRVVRSLWQMARRSAFDEDYTDDLLRRDLLALYDGYFTIKGDAMFEPLDDFRAQIASKIAEGYGMPLPGDVLFR